MKKRLVSQVRQTSDICLFCVFRPRRDTPLVHQTNRSSHRTISSSVCQRAPAGAAAAAREDDDEDAFPLLRHNAAAATGGWPTAAPVQRSAPLSSTRLPPKSSSQAQQSRPVGQGCRRQGSRPDRFGGHDRRSQEGQQEERPRFTIRKLNVKKDYPPRLEGRQDAAWGEHQAGGEGSWQQRPQRRHNEFQNGNTAQRHIGSTGAEGGLRITRSAAPFSSFWDARSGSNQESPSTSAGKLGLPDLPPRAPRFGSNGDSAHTSVARSTYRVQEDNKTLSFEPLAQQRARPGPHQSNANTSPGLEQDLTAVEKAQRQQEQAMERFRRSGRFDVEEEVDLPAQGVQKRNNQPAQARYSRRQAPDFDFEMMEAERALNGERGREKKVKKRQKSIQETKPTLIIPEFMSVQQLAQSMKVKTEDLLRKLDEEGFEDPRYDHLLDAETSAMFADIYGFEPVTGVQEMQDLVSRPPPEDVSVLPPRPPIVTIMGHVDHGKTTILDWLRKSSVAAGEHGGITQHIGAFSVMMPGSERQITFLDTPGHEAFLDMRRRGANVTDIVVLVVAADDSVKPQTIEAIKHALEARVQLIVAINKVDKHDANIEQVKQDLTRHEIVVEDYGGDYQAIPVSGKTGQGMEQLEEAIITLADVLDLRAEQDIPAEGQIIEAKVTNAGRVATVLVRRGVLRIGDFIVAGSTWGRVRTLRNDAGNLVQQAYPGDPVQVDGWRGLDPTAGLEVLQADNEQHAKDVVEYRLERAELTSLATDAATINVARTKEAEARAKVLEWEKENKVRRRRHDNEGWIDSDDSAGPKEVHFVIKADVAGSVEAIVAAVSAIGNHEIRANVIHSGTGPVTESDIQMLATTGETGYAISFNQPVDGTMHNLAHAAGLQVLDHNIIYKVTDVVKEKVEAALPPIITTRILGEAEVGKIFDVTIKKQKFRIAGCKVTKGTISRSNRVQVIRDGETIYTGTLESLKNVKKDVTEMRNGTECGVGFKDWANAQEGDVVQCFEEKEEKRKLYG